MALSPYPTAAFMGSFTEKGKWYRIQKSPKGRYICNCLGFQSKRNTKGTCRHIIAYLRIGYDLPFWAKRRFNDATGKWEEVK
jgi:hypothetical protein